jgi:tRNA (guanine6-N2)-methyltransferase
MTDPRGAPQTPTIDWDRQVTDRLVLRSLRGAVDYLADEVRALETTGMARVGVVRQHADRVEIELRGPLAALRGLYFYSECAVDLGELGGAGALAGGPVAERLRRSLDEGALSALGGRAIRFRVGDLGDARWVVRDHLAEAWGWVNSPRGWQVNLDLVDGRLAATLGDLHLTRRHGRLERLPASTTPVLAAALVRLAKIPDGATVLDPFCGAGTNLVLAHTMAAPALLIGGDLSAGALRQTRLNAASRDAPLQAVRADATRQPIASGTVDRVVANLPFGKRVGSHGSNQTLYPRFLHELDRVLTGDGRAVLLTEDKRLLVESVQRTRGVRIIKEVTFASGGAHPTAYVLVRSRGQARRRAR